MQESNCMEKWQTVVAHCAAAQTPELAQGAAWDEDAGRRTGWRIIFAGCSNTLKQLLYYSLTLKFSDQLSQCKLGLSCKEDFCLVQADQH